MSNQREIIEIPARPAEAQDRPEKLRVAAYCRVSTSQEAQQNSYQAQRAYYLDKIESNPDWVLADIFADEAISGTSVDNRTEFQRMIRWCKKGKIDLILTKSISRFARNTEDCLHYVRLLKGLQIPVIFETERLDTSQMDSEFFLAMLGANSQAESEATSSRVKWGVRAAFRDGKVRYQYKRWLGYRKGEDGNPEIVPEEAAVVRKIFDAYLAGQSLKMIKHMLEKEKIPTKTGLTEWSVPAIQNILKNEKYTGDALLQKTYTTDPISKRQKKNLGELPQYLVKNSHPAIISREAFLLVQKEMTRRTAARGMKKPPEPHQEKKIYSSKYALSGVLFCGTCGAPYRRCTWKRNGKTRIVWRCQNRLKNGTRGCADFPTIEEADLHRALVAAINGMLHQQEYLLAPFEKLGIIERSQALVSQKQQLDDRIVDLIMQCTDSRNWDHNAEPFRSLMEQRRKISQVVSQLPYQLRAYHDGIARCVLGKVTVLNTECLQIAFKGGASVKQSF